MCCFSSNLNEFNPYFINQLDEITHGAVRVTFFGTTSLLFDDGETQLLIDGFFSRPSFFKAVFGKLKTNQQLVDEILANQKISRLKGVFTSHSHHDHAMDSAYIAKVTNCVLFGSLSTINIGRGADLTENQMTQFEHGNEFKLGNFSIKILNAKHSPQARIIADAGQEIRNPLKQPARIRAFKEGGNFDFVIKHGEHTMVVKSSCNYIQNALDNVRADVLFLGVTGLTNQNANFQEEFYKHVIKATNPKLVIPMHWDNFFRPLTTDLKSLPNLIDNAKKNFNYLIQRTKVDGIEFRILQGFSRILLFKTVVV